MAHYAQIDENNIVTQVLVVNDYYEHTNTAQEFLSNELGLGGTWIQTSYNGRIRKNYAGIGYTYDATRDAFIPPKPYESWLLNEDTCLWEAPVPHPQDENKYSWNEELQQWENVND
jgi:hypothetical protein